MDLHRFIRRFRPRKQTPAERLAEQMRETARDALEQLRGAVDEIWLARPALTLPRPRARLPRPERPAPAPVPPRRAKRGPAAVIRLGRGLRVRVVRPEGGDGRDREG